jgi:hypothetical protein
MKPLCIYHGACDDGFAAAWVVRKRFRDAVEFRYYGANATKIRLAMKPTLVCSGHHAPRLSHNAEPSGSRLPGPASCRSRGQDRREPEGSRAAGRIDAACRSGHSAVRPRLRRSAHSCPAPEPGKPLVQAGPYVPGGPERPEGRQGTAHDASNRGAHVGGQGHYKAKNQGHTALAGWRPGLPERPAGSPRCEGKSSLCRGRKSPRSLAFDRTRLANHFEQVDNLWVKFSPRAAGMIYPVKRFFHRPNELVPC